MPSASREFTPSSSGFSRNQLSGESLNGHFYHTLTNNDKFVFGNPLHFSEHQSNDFEAKTRATAPAFSAINDFHSPVQTQPSTTNDLNAEEYLTLENTEKYNREAFIESRRSAGKDLNAESAFVEERAEVNSLLDGNAPSERSYFDNEQSALFLRDPKRRRRKYSASSIPVSTVSAFSAFGRKSQTKKPPKRSTLQLLMNSSIMFGREFCYAVEGGLTTPILLSIGLPLNMYSLVWVLSPILGFILQPIIGSLSDRCKCRWGRRRPFILGLAILLLIGLTLFLNGEQFVSISSTNGNIRRVSLTSSVTIAAIVVTVAGVVLFDFSADFIEGPIRAYAMDVCDEEDIRKSLLFQAIFTGAGGAFGYASGGISWTRDTPLRRVFPSDRQVVYTVSAVIFVICCIFNFLSIPENGPEQENANEEVENPAPRQGNYHLSKTQQRSNKKQENSKVFEVQKQTNQDGEEKTHRSAEAAILRILAKRNRDRLFEEFERNHSLQTNKGYREENSNLQDSSLRSKRFGKRNEHYKTLIKRKKRKKHLNNSKKLKLNFQNLAPKPLSTYGTFHPTEKHINDENNSNVVSVYQPHQLSWPFTMFYQQQQSNPLSNGSNQLTGLNDALLAQNRASVNYNKGINNLEPSTDSDSNEPRPHRANSMLEHYFPYAPVDPALKHFQQTCVTDNSFQNSKPKKKIFPDPDHDRFSDVFSSISERITTEQNNNQHNDSSESVGGLKSLCLSIRTMPKELRCLCVCHLLGWISFLSIALFFTDFVGQVVMKGDPRAPSNSRREQEYFRGVEIGNWGLTINAAVSCFYCVLLKFLIRKLGFRVMYVFGYFVFALGVCFMAVFPTIVVILTLSTAIGIMSATLYTIPYMLVAQYHEERKNSPEIASERGVGIDCALVTCMIQLAQIITGLGIGALVNWAETVTVTVIVASVIGCLGAIWAAVLVKY